MKYINSYRNLFNDGECLFTDGYLTNGTGIRIDLGELEGDKLYISYDVQRSNNSISGTYYMRVYDSGNYVCFSNYSKGTPSITLESKNDATAKSLTIENNQWYKVYEIYDFKAGIVDMYVNGELFATTTNAKIANPAYIKLNLPTNGGNPTEHIAVKNIIISDNEFDVTDEVVEIPLEKLSSDWDEDDNNYFTESADKTLMFQGKRPVGYKIKDAVLSIYGIESGTVHNVEINGEKYDLAERSSLSVKVNDYTKISITSAI